MGGGNGRGGKLCGVATGSSNEYHGEKVGNGYRSAWSGVELGVSATRCRPLTLTLTLQPDTGHAGARACARLG